MTFYVLLEKKTKIINMIYSILYDIQYSVRSIPHLTNYILSYFPTGSYLSITAAFYFPKIATIPSPSPHSFRTLSLSLTRGNLFVLPLNLGRLGTAANNKVMLYEFQAGSC